MLKHSRQVRTHICACYVSISVVAMLLMSGCSVPNHMHVTEGVSPANSETNVRFRTTYYFRAFDYCWAADAKTDDGLKYRDVIPETDMVYRYRMTGKASALGSKIRFESGTLEKDEIEPFGKSLPKPADEEKKDGSGDHSSGGVETGGAGTGGAGTSGGEDEKDRCALGKVRKRGFQIMGPEGMSEFNQNERLVLAMYTSAKPLTETLQEYAGRVTSVTANPSDRLLPLVRENMRTLEADRALDGLAVRTVSDRKPTLDEIFKEAIAAFEGKEDAR